MNRNLSTFLDGSRLTAALIVVAGHTEWTFAPGFIPFVRSGHLATLAVGLFFVLSGFVIGYAVDQKESTARTYFISRAARIYSVVVPALIMTLLLDTVSKFIWPASHLAELSQLGFLKDLARYAFSLTFLNGIWGWNLTPGSNVPFWSLSYEVPYYIIFGLWFFGNAVWRVVSVVLLIVFGPYISLLFFLWIFGLSCYHVVKAISITRAQGRTLLAFSFLLLLSAPYFARFFSEASPFGGGIGSLTQFFLSGIPFAGCIVGFGFADIPLGFLSKFIRWAAGATFTLYLVHYPLGMLLRSIMPSDWPLPARWIGIFASVTIVCFLIAEFTERQKNWWRAGIDWIFVRVTDRNSGTERRRRPA